jgi:glycosyltransferase involved in cell wall biosynthesis
MRILIVTGNFAGENRNPWLLDDLAIALADAGDDVDVLAYDTKHGRTQGRNQYSDKRIRVFGVGSKKVRQGRLGKLASYLSAGWGLHTAGYRMVRRRRYDLCIYTSIGMFSWGLPSRLRREGIARRTVFVLWDFFPVHQLEIGRITQKALSRPLKILEAQSMKRADVIAVMSPANERYLRIYHRSVHARTAIIPPWASDPISLGAGHVPRRERFTVIFGGQLVPGRSVETLLHAARILESALVPLDLLIIGDGSGRSDLMALAKRLGLESATFVSRLPRDEYRKLLQSAHVGIAVTVAGVTPPTFPSKIAEYCASSVSVVVCVEPASDAGTIVKAAGAGLSVPAGDEAKLASAIRALYEEHANGLLESRARRARELFENELSVSRAADRIRALAR